MYNSFMDNFRYQSPHNTNAFWNVDAGPPFPVKKYKPRFDYYKNDSKSRNSPNVTEEFAQMGLQSGGNPKRQKSMEFKRNKQKKKGPMNDSAKSDNTSKTE